MEAIDYRKLAQMLDGHEHEHGFTAHVMKLAKTNRLVIVSAIGDDVVRFEGAYNDEFDCFHGGTVFFDKDKTAYTRNCKLNSRRPIECFWEKHSNYNWKFLTTIPHAKFSMKRNGKNWCQCIVFCLEDV